MLFAALSMTLTGCARMNSASATEEALCEAWEGTLFLPSRADTQETAIKLNDQYRIQEAACD
jgi:hypothetical protein